MQIFSMYSNEFFHPHKQYPSRTSAIFLTKFLLLPKSIAMVWMHVWAWKKNSVTFIWAVEITHFQWIIEKNVSFSILFKICIQSYLIFLFLQLLYLFSPRRHSCFSVCVSRALLKFRCNSAQHCKWSHNVCYGMVVFGRIPGLLHNTVLLM